jgi:hypothetical protein
MLVKDGAPLAQVERAASVVVLVGEDGSEVVTVLHDCNSTGRRYRKQHPTRKRKFVEQHSRAA